jgi:Ca-activated chloride channel family protein
LENTSANFRFSAAVAEFGLLLRQSQFLQNSSFNQVRSLAKSALGTDPNGYRTEFLQLVDAAQNLTKDIVRKTPSR